MLEQEVNEQLPEGALATTQWTGKYAQWFAEAFTKLTNNPAPELDTVNVKAFGQGILILAFNKGCFVGAVRVPFGLYMDIRKEMEEKRASSE